MEKEKWMVMDLERGTGMGKGLGWELEKGSGSERGMGRVREKDLEKEKERGLERVMCLVMGMAMVKGREKG